MSGNLPFIMRMGQVNNAHHSIVSIKVERELNKTFYEGSVFKVTIDSHGFKVSSAILIDTLGNSSTGETAIRNAAMLAENERR
jgi:hypothetical protein